MKKIIDDAKVKVGNLYRITTLLFHDRINDIGIYECLDNNCSDDYIKFISLYVEYNRKNNYNAGYQYNQSRSRYIDETATIIDLGKKEDYPEYFL